MSVGFLDTWTLLEQTSSVGMSVMNLKIKQKVPIGLLI